MTHLQSRTSLLSSGDWGVFHLYHESLELLSGPQGHLANPHIEVTHIVGPAIKMNCRSGLQAETAEFDNSQLTVRVDQMEY